MALVWPDGWERTNGYHRQGRIFGHEITHGRGITKIQRELELMWKDSGLQGTDLRIDTDHDPEQLRQDGLPYASARRPQDPGVVVYYRLGGVPYVMACDRFLRYEDNMWAIGKLLEDKRRSIRYGATTASREFAGYAQLPSGDDGQSIIVGSGAIRSPHEILGISEEAPHGVAKAAYRALVKQYHPDRPDGDAEKFREVETAWTWWEANHA